MFKEFGRHVFIFGLLASEFQGHGQHGEAIRGHPRRTIGLFQPYVAWQRPRTVEHADVVESEKSAGEDVVALNVFPIHPPGEVNEEFLEDAAQKNTVSASARS